MPTLPDLSMPHLREPDAAPDAPGAQAKAADPREQREYTFAFRYQDARKRVFEGTFTNRILTIEQKIAHGVARARRQAGLPTEALSDVVVEMIFILTYLDLSLTQRPDWATHLSQQTEEALVQAIFEEVANHERVFRGHRPIAAPSAGEPR